MQTIEYLAAAKAKLQISSDYELAKRLGVSRQSVSDLVHGATMKNSTAARVAEILEIDPLRVIADAELERASGPEQRKLWERIAARVAAGVLVAIGAATIAPSPARADEAAAVYYVKRRRWLFPLVPPAGDDELGPA